MYYLAFRRVEPHIPPGLPRRSNVEIILECLTVILTFKCEIQGGIISKQSYLGADLIGLIIYIDQEENWAQGRALGDTGCNLYRFRFLPINHYSLGSTPKESSDPVQHMSVNTVLIQCPQKFAVIYLVIGLREI